MPHYEVGRGSQPSPTALAARNIAWGGEKSAQWQSERPNVGRHRKGGHGHRPLGVFGKTKFVATKVTGSPQGTPPMPRQRNRGIGDSAI
jgi:hypothetical protein